MGGRYSDSNGVTGLGGASESLGSVAHVPVEQRDRARRYIHEEAGLRYPEEDQQADRQEWLEEMLDILGLRDQAV